VASHSSSRCRGRAGRMGCRRDQDRASRAGDPYRGLVTAGLHKVHAGSTSNFKRPIGQALRRIDLTHPDGRDFLPGCSRPWTYSPRTCARGPVGISALTSKDVRPTNPSIIYVRGSAFGPRGPEAGRAVTTRALLARSGMQQILSRSDTVGGWPSRLHLPSVTWLAGWPLPEPSARPCTAGLSRASRP